MIVVLNRHKAVFFLSLLIWWSFEINQQKQQAHSSIALLSTTDISQRVSKNRPALEKCPRFCDQLRSLMNPSFFCNRIQRPDGCRKNHGGKDAKKWRKARKPSTRSVTIFIIDDLKIILLLFWIRIIPCLCIFPLDFFL